MDKPKAGDLIPPIYLVDGHLFFTEADAIQAAIQYGSAAIVNTVVEPSGLLRSDIISIDPDGCVVSRRTSMRAMVEMEMDDDWTDGAMWIEPLPLKDN